MDDDIQRLLTELNAAIERSQIDGTIDGAERAELRSLVERVERALAEPDGEHEGVIEHLESTAVQFEGRHASLAAALRSVVGMLTTYGI